MKKSSEQNLENKYNRDEIANTVKEAALTSYGVSEIVTVNEKGKEEDAIYVHFNDEDGTFSLDVHVNIMEGIKVTETIRSLRKTIRFYMDRLYPKACQMINTYAEDFSSKK